MKVFGFFAPVHSLFTLISAAGVVSSRPETSTPHLLYNKPKVYFSMKEELLLALIAESAFMTTRSICVRATSNESDLHRNRLGLAIGVGFLWLATLELYVHTRKFFSKVGPLLEDEKVLELV
jgi:hypothetical protein